jgi:hypothetical protein
VIQDIALIEPAANFHSLGEPSSVWLFSCSAVSRATPGVCGLCVASRILLA